MELPDPPEGWGLKALIEIDLGSWSASYWSANAYVYGYGTTARYAVLDALGRIENADVFDRLSGMEASTVDLVKALGIRAKPTNVRRI
jgi:hypothetical protein